MAAKTLFTCDGPQYHPSYKGKTTDPAADGWFAAELDGDGVAVYRIVPAELPPTFELHFCEWECFSLWAGARFRRMKAEEKPAQEEVIADTSN